MPMFSYVARDRGGKVRKGALQMESSQALVRQLRGRGLFVMEYNVATPSRKRSGKFKLSEINITKAKVKTKELALFSRQFASMVSAGLNLVDCIEALEQNSDNPTLREAAAGIRQDVMEGKPLAEAMSKYPKVFDNLYVSMVEAAQSTGSFATPLEDLAVMLEKTEEVKRKVKSALTQPIITIVFAIVITLALIRFAIPTFSGLFNQLGPDKLPGPTKMLMSISDALQGIQGLIAVGAVILVSVLFKKMVSTKQGKRTWDRVKLKLPLFGPIILKRSIALFSRTLSLLLSSGVEYLTALTIASNVADNEIIKEVLEDAKKTITQGSDLSEAFAKSEVFPPLVNQLIDSGVKTGRVPEMLSHISAIYEEEVNQGVEALTATLTPILTLIVGGLILGVLVGLYLPVFKIGELLMSTGG
jgi:type IV pilus assembly protein PilC